MEGVYRPEETDGNNSLFANFYDQIRNALRVKEGSEITILKRMDDGFSGAEVYLIDYEGSAEKGAYFLKLAAEKVEKTVDFPPFPCASLVENQWTGCDMRLYTIAGGSSREYVSLKSLALRGKLESLQDFLTAHFDVCQGRDAYKAGGVVAPSVVISRIIGRRFEENSVLSRTLLNSVSGDPRIAGRINFSGHHLPNPFSFGFQSELWNGIKIHESLCASHCDMHSANIMVNTSKHDFTLIDWEQWHRNGFPFFDSAYLETGELLAAGKRYAINEWLENIQDLVKNRAEEFDGLKIATNIRNAEKEWIENSYSEQFSYKDEFSQARLLARIMAGLDYAGKKGLSHEDWRLKAFLYAACHLEALLENFSLKEWGKSPEIKWLQGIGDEEQRCVALELHDWMHGFGSESRRILVCGRKRKYEDGLAKCLARISWDMIVSYHNENENNKIFDAIRAKKDIVPLYGGKNPMPVEFDNARVGWLFAMGYSGHPDSTADSLRQWRNNRCADYVKKTYETFMHQHTAEDCDIVVDCDSFRGDEGFLIRLLEFFDGCSFARMALIGIDDPPLDPSSEYEDRDIRHFRLSMEKFASYCLEYHADAPSEQVILPAARPGGRLILDKDDKKFIEGAFEIVFDEALGDNPPDEKAIKNFYYGYPISWSAIARNELVARKEIKEAQDILRQSSGKNVEIIYVSSLPGGGASVLCRCICWKMRNEWPTLVLKELNQNTEEALKRISTLTGLRILVLMDNNFSSVDAEKIRMFMRHENISASIILTQRDYPLTTGTHVRVIGSGNIKRIPLGLLSLEDNMNFMRAYTSQIEASAYPQAEKDRRCAKVKNLSQKVEFEKLRLPFFYGMFAFEKDFVSVEKYVTDFMKRVEDKPGYIKLAKYAALVTAFTSGPGLPLSICRSLAGGDANLKRKSLIEKIHKNCGSIVHIQGNSARISHPVLAEMLLDRYSQEGASHGLFQIAHDFITDISQLLPGEEAGKDVEKLAMDLFIKRDMDREQSKFSEIIQEINDHAMSIKLFDALTDTFPENAHFHQHYGRYKIYANPHDMEGALEHFDMAINLDKNNEIHWHARGNMYIKYIKTSLAAYEEVNEIYNNLKTYVDLAISDFEKAIELIRQNAASGTNEMQYKYPYCSIIEIAEVILRAIQKYIPREAFPEVFLQSEDPAEAWAGSLLEKALAYESQIDIVFGGFDNDDFYDIEKRKLCALKYNYDKLEKNTQAQPDNKFLSSAYAWSSTLEDLKLSSDRALKVAKICENSLLQKEHGSGLIWKFFYASLLSNEYDAVSAANILLAIPDSEHNPQINFLVFSLYFARLIHTGDRIWLKDTIKYLENSRSLSGSMYYKRKCWFYYSECNKFNLALSHQPKTELTTIITSEVKNRQSGYMHLKDFPELSVFFIPAHLNIKIGQSFSQTGKYVVGLSYQGLRVEDIPRDPN